MMHLGGARQAELLVRAPEIELLGQEAEAVDQPDKFFALSTDNRAALGGRRIR